MGTFTSFNTTGQSIPGGGMTLDELMAQRRKLAEAQSGIQAQAQPTIAGGVGQMINSFFTGLREHQAMEQERQGRQSFAEAMSRINPQTGEFANPSDASAVAALDPQAYGQMVSAALQGHLAAARQAEQEQAALNLEKTRETYESGLPQTPRAKALADYNSGKLGTVGSPEAIAARDAAIRASEAPQLTIEDRKERNRLSDLYLATGNNLSQLQTASSLIDQGIVGGSTWSGWKQGLSKINPFGDKEMSDRTEQFNLIMNQGGLTDTISNALGPAAAANFVRQMTDMSVDPKARQSILTNMIAQLKAANETTRARLQEIAPNESLPQIPNTGPALSAEAENALLQEARQAIAAGAPRDQVIQRLRQRGADPGKL